MGKRASVTTTITCVAAGHVIKSPIQQGPRSKFLSGGGGGGGLKKSAWTNFFFWGGGMLGNFYLISLK